MSKMLKRERLARRRETRTKQRNQEREDLFICDYVKHKYPTIHAEALQIYEALFNHYPSKIDLRKTEEHKLWKIRGILNLHPALNICQVPHDAQLSVFFPQPTTPNLESTTTNLEVTVPEATAPESPNLEATAPEPPNLEATAPEPPNLEATVPEATAPKSPNLEATAPEPPNLEATAPEPPNLEATVPEATAPESPNLEATAPEPPNLEATAPEPQNPKSKGKIVYKDNMQLIIPLIKSPVKHPGVITETLQIITEEIVQEHPQSIDQIDPKILDQLITELRADPDLGSIFKDMEQQAEFEELDMDIDIGIDTRLEDELNWEFW